MFNKIKNFFRKGEPCKFECQNEKGACLENSFTGIFGCTRNAGHEGQHVACGTSGHNYKSWG